MNDSTATASNSMARTASVVDSPGLHQRLVMGALEKMDEGHLRLQLPDGTIKHLGNPEGPHTATLTIIRPSFFSRVLLYGDVGFGEAYVEGDCDTDNIEKLIEAIRTKDFDTFAMIVMVDSSQLHAICMDTYPPVIYLNDQSKHLIDLVHAYNRMDGGEHAKVAYTFDAGPNPFCFVRQEHLDEFLSLVKHFYPTTNGDVHKHVSNGTQHAFAINLPILPNVLERIIHTKIGSGPQVTL